MKRTATRHIARVRAAIAEVQASDLAAGVHDRSRRGTARVPARRGDRAARGDRRPLPVPAHRAAVPARRRRDRRDAGRPHLRLRACRRTSRWPGASADTEAPPTLVDNVETLAHVTVALAEGADWFREVGTDESPGTVLCTVSGCVTRAGVGEFTMGTPLREIIETLGGGAAARPHDPRRAAGRGRRDHHRRPARHARELGRHAGDRLRARRGGVHRASTTRPTSRRSAASVSRFLAVESCGQCTPCKQDSLLITDALHAHRDVRGHRGRSRRRAPADRDGRVRRALLAGDAGTGGDRQHARRVRRRARSARRAHRARRRGDGDRPDARPPRRRGDRSTRSTRASSPTGRSATTGRARRPPTASTTTAPTTKSSDSPFSVCLTSIFGVKHTENALIHSPRPARTEGSELGDVEYALTRADWQARAEPAELTGTGGRRAPHRLTAGPGVTSARPATPATHVRRCTACRCG